MKPPHKHFFTSLKQVEKRLKLDDGNHRRHHNHHRHHHKPKPNQPKPPQALRSTSTTTTPTPHQPSTTTPSNNPSRIPLYQRRHSPVTQFRKQFIRKRRRWGVDSMFELLGLSDFDCKGAEMAEVGDDEFFDKIVKVKGPKCKKEVERLDNWIKYFLNSGREPLRLAHLLMAKAAVVAAAGADELEFPCTVDEFLENDPPLD
ncbi:hypothetical protein HanLR1_Chr00c2100g0834351 [Helianthus annuus]|nr:hypothetical protein HanLR1_Chr00c2100g0834351 [Helianthus annuus]